MSTLADALAPMPMSAPPRLHVVLVAPEIPWNTGNAGRTCLAVGAELHLVRPLGFSLDDRAIRRSGLDYWARVVPHLHVWPSWADLEQKLPELGAAFFFAPHAARDFRAPGYPPATVLVFGCESVGLPDEILARYAADTVSLPMLDPDLRSLNLSTTVAVAAYEVQRQWTAAAQAASGPLSPIPSPRPRRRD
jgi:tRNA (cytidine/uridine-2'-O-)-methyltransferase